MSMGYQSFMDRNRSKERDVHSLPISGMIKPKDQIMTNPLQPVDLREVANSNNGEQREMVKLLFNRFDAARNKRKHYNKIWNDISIYIVPSLNNNFNTAGTAATSYSSQAIETYIRNSNLVYDATAIIACNKIAGALYSFTNNPSLKWFNHDLPVTKNENYKRVKEKATTKTWLTKRRDTVLQYLNKALASCSNTLYNEAIGYGTSSIFLRETLDANVMVGKSISLETLYVAEDENGIVNTVIRELELNAANAISKFGNDNVHSSVRRDMIDSPDKTKKYLHIVAPNKWRILDKKDTKNKPYLDIYLDYENRVIVHHQGFDEFPYGIARMNVPSNAPYGISPGMMVLPDVKTVNVFERINIDIGNKVGNPPMHMMADNYVTPLSMVPSGISLYNDPAGMAQPLQTVGNPTIMENALLRKKQAIKEGFFNDLLMPAKGNTTYEVQEESLLQMRLMAPWQGTFELELYEPLIRRAEGILERVGNILPDTPEDVLALYDGKLPPLSIVHTSPLSLAQKHSVLQAIDRTIQFSGGLASIGGMDSIKVPETISYYAENSGMPLDLIRDAKEVKTIQDARAQQQQQMTEKTMMTEEAKQAKALADAEKSSATADTMTPSQSNSGGGAPDMASLMAMMGGQQ